MSDTPETPPRNLNVNVSDDRYGKFINWVAVVGIGTVFLVVYMIGVYLPQERYRLERDRLSDQTNAKMGETLQGVGNTMTLLVEQDRHHETASIEVQRSMQEQTKILQQIMTDQRNGVWRDEPKKPAINP